MLKTDNGFELDLNFSPKPVIVCLVLLGIGCFILAVINRDPEQILRLDLLAIVILLLCWLTWNLDQNHSAISRWLTVMLLIGYLYTFIFFFGITGLLPALFVPVALAALLLKLPAALLFAGFETLTTLFFYPADKGSEYLTLVISLLGGWLFCVFYAWITKPVREVAQWSWEYQQKALRELTEARNSREQYEQSLKDLADANVQMRSLNRLAQNLRQAAENAKTAKDQFVANVSHELRTPLNMITGYTEMMLSTPGMYGRKMPRALLADLAVIQRNAEHLSRLINDVLDLSQVEADQMALSKEFVNFQEVVDFTMSAVQPLYRLKHLSLEQDIMPDLPPVFCDRTRMQEVLLNILSNAGRFTEQGGVQIHVRKEGNSLLVSINDTGPGIAEEDLDRLFHPFEQLDASIRRKHGGTGLGLSISKRFIEMHDGRIWVESRIGEGTTFHFTIPVTLPKAVSSSPLRWLNPYSPYEAPGHLPKLPAPGRPRYVIVEKNAALTTLIHRYMGEVDTVAVEDPEAIKTEVEHSGAQAILLNLHSPNPCLEDLDPYLLNEANIPVIACDIASTQDQAADRELAGILVKPISRQRLFEALQRLGINQGTVLIIDDEPDALQLFARMLASEGENYHVLFARDGQEAMEVLQESRPDVILLDLVMPHLDGFRLLQLLRTERADLANIPVIVISAHDPSGQPIISSGLLVRQKEGLSIRQTLSCIRVISQILTSSGKLTDPTHSASPAA